MAAFLAAPPAVCGGGGGVSVALGPRCLLLSPSNSRHKDVTRGTHHRISSLAFQNDVPARPSLSVRGSSRGNLKLPSVFSRGMPNSHVSTSSSVFLSGDQGSLRGLVPIFPSKRGSSMWAQARKSTSSGPCFPVLTEKPEWWWRFLSTVPYLISLQISDAGFYIQPFLEHHEKFENLIYYVPGAVKRWSIWFPMLYCYLAYLGGVKNKKWPHFFRYHLMTAMLLENILQVVWVSSNFAPLIHFNGTFGMYYWAAVGFLYIFIMLEGIRCALGGKYYKIPFVSESALIHTLYHVGGFQRPF